MSHPAIDNHGNRIFIYVTSDSGQVPGVSTRIRENESDQASYSRQRSSDSGVSQLSTGGESVRSVTPIAAPGRENKKNPDKDLEKLQGVVKKLRLCIRKLVLVFVVITCILISAVVAVGVHSFHPYVNPAEHSVNAEQAGVADDTLSSLCIPCADLSQDVSVEELRMENNPDLCCARNQTQFHKLLQWYVDVKIQQAEEDRSFRQPPSSNTLKSSAHLILNPTVDLAAEGNTSKTMKHWLYNDAAAHLFNVAFIPSTGHIRIKNTGKYFLYTRASVLFKASNDPPLIHSVHKKSASSALRELLRAVRINRWSSALRYDVQTSFLSGTFDLRENDEVYVSLNNIARLYFSERNYRSTNFGLFMI